MIIDCPVHGPQHISEDKRIKRCQSCKRVRKQQQRMKRKRDLVQAHGGKCQQCGYNASPWALTFHHRDPKLKLFSLSHLEQYTQEAIALEASKCDLLCQNCHMQLHERLYYSGSFL